MASTPRVAATAASGSSPAVGGWGHSSAGRPGSADHSVDGGYSAVHQSVEPGWRPHYDDRHGQGYFFFGQYPRKEEPEHQPFTPLVARFAAAFPAIEPVSDLRGSGQLPLAFVMHGIHVYDVNLKAIAGTLSTLGSVVNRYG